MRDHGIALTALLTVICPHRAKRRWKAPAVGNRTDPGPRRRAMPLVHRVWEQAIHSSTAEFRFRCPRTAGLRCDSSRSRCRTAYGRQTGSKVQVAYDELLGTAKSPRP